MLAKNLFDFLPHRLREEKLFCSQAIMLNQSIKWCLLSWHDSNDDKDDILTLTIYNIEKDLNCKTMMTTKKNMTGDVVVIMLLLMCVHAIVCVQNEHIHMIRVKHKSEQERERNDFQSIFFSSEGEKWQMQTKQSAIVSRKEQRQERERNIYVM